MSFWGAGKGFLWDSYACKAVERAMQAYVVGNQHDAEARLEDLVSSAKHGSLCIKEAVRFIAADYDDGDSNERTAAKTLLRDMISRCPNRCMDFVAAALSSSTNRRLRRVAMKQIDSLAAGFRDRAFQYVLRHCSHSDSLVLKAAEREIGAFTKRCPTEAETVLLAALDQETAPPIVTAALLHLGYSSHCPVVGEKLAAALLCGCCDKEESVRSAAVRKLVPSAKVLREKASELIEALLRASYSGTKCVRCEALRQVSNAAKAFSSRRVDFLEALLYSCGDRELECSRTAKEQLLELFRAHPEMAINCLAFWLGKEDECAPATESTLKQGSPRKRLRREDEGVRSAGDPDVDRRCRHCYKLRDTPQLRKFQRREEAKGAESVHALDGKRRRSEDSDDASQRGKRKAGGGSSTPPAGRRAQSLSPPR